MDALRITPIPLLTDNYAYVLEEPRSGAVAVVDPSEAAPVMAKLGGRLDWILNTHHHWDHVGGNLALREKFGAKVVAPMKDADRVPGFDVGVTEGVPFRLGDVELFALEVPGHTTGAVAYYTPAASAVFTGDTLFLMGCGRLFEGTPAQMFASLAKLKRLPGETRVYCGHEYTLANGRFALTEEPENEAIRARVAAVDKTRVTVPGTMTEELQTNPFLRALTVEAFAEVRRRKDESR